MPTIFTGRLITPASFNERYIYEVSHSGDNVIRTGNSPRITDGFTKFHLDYVKGTGVGTGTELWDLTRSYQNSPPRQITVEICLGGKASKTDKPTVQDGM